MSSNSAASAANGVNAARQFKSVNGKSLDNNQGNLTFIKAKDLAAAGTTGVVAEGILEAKLANAFGGTDYKISANGATVIVNGTASLTSQMSKVDLGAYVQIQYLGMEAAKSGKFAGKPSHRFIVGVATEDEGAE